MKSEGLTVADLTEEHIGWYMQIDVDVPKGQFGPPHIAIKLGDIRRWEYPAGTPRVGLLDVSTKRPGIAGDERSNFPPGRPRQAHPPDTEATQAEEAMSDLVADVEAGFAIGTAERLRVLEVRAQTQTQRAADELARGNHDYGVMLLVCALNTTEQIDNAEADRSSAHASQNS